MSIIRNAAKCKKCGDVIESVSRHDFKWCKCESIAVDGGKSYIRRVGNPEDVIDMCVFLNDDNQDNNKNIILGDEKCLS